MDIESEIQDKARSLGFDLCGIARVRRLTVDRDRFDRWIASGYQSTLGYMCRNTDKRFDPALLFPGARSVIVCAASYNRKQAPGNVAAANPAVHDNPTTANPAVGDNTRAVNPSEPGSNTAKPGWRCDPCEDTLLGVCTLSRQTITAAPSVSSCTLSRRTIPTTPPAPGADRNHLDPEHRPRIASYALTRDYHLLLRERLQELCEFIRSLDPSFEGRPFVDTAPLLEKRWAVEAGLGWIGRNSLLINRRYGSWLMLGEIVTSLELTPSPAGIGQTPRRMNTNEYATSSEVTDDMATSHPTHDCGLAESRSSSRPEASGELPDGDSMCGSCRRCIEACPNGAIVSPRVIDTRRCISRMTVESKYSPQAASVTGNDAATRLTTAISHRTATEPEGTYPEGHISAGNIAAMHTGHSATTKPPGTYPIHGTDARNGLYDTTTTRHVSHIKAGTEDKYPEAGEPRAAQQEHASSQTGNASRPSLHGWIFGCDECQLCCPYNIKAEISPCSIFTSQAPLLPPTAGEWLAMTTEEFNTRFGDTPLSRCGLSNIQQNVRSNTGE